MKHNAQYSKSAKGTQYLGLAPTKQLVFERYITLLEKWRSITNLVSKNDIENVWMRHIADCLPIRLLSPKARHWLDIGSGAGFPGVVLAIQLMDIPGATVHVVDSDTRKCVFLRGVMRELQLPIHVHNRRIESLSPKEIGPINAITARACASVPEIMKMAVPFLNAGAVAILPRGRQERELDKLDTRCYSTHDYPNPFGGGGHILLVEKRIISELV